MRNTKTVSQQFALITLMVFLTILCLTRIADAQDTEADLELYDLRPADTSSPRDTLHGFLTDATEAIKRWQEGESSKHLTQAYGRAVETLDFDTTPYSDSWHIRAERLLLLKEILDRIELPPEDQIPGDDEVGDGAITEWTIPDTRITIRRVELGTRAGEYLFAADTVQRLPRMYRHMRHLPYRTTTTAGIFEQWVESDRTDSALERQIRDRLNPVDASNPRATLNGFLDSVNRAYTLAMTAQAALDADPPTLTRKEAGEIEKQADNLLQRAAFTLDLSKISRALQEDVGIESALQLKEIFDRMALPPLDSVPDEQMVAATREWLTENSSASSPVRWRYPGTAIEIVEILEGPRQGQFLFDTATVDRIDDDFDEVKDLPYRDDFESLDYLSPAKSEGFHLAYTATPGGLVPGASFLGRLLDDLPPWLATMRSGQTTWQWLGMALCFLAVAAVAYLIVRLFRRLATRLITPLDGWLMILAPIIIAAVVSLATDFVDNDLNITGYQLASVRAGASAIVVLLTVWVVFNLCKVIAESIIALPRIHEESIDATLLRLSASVIGFLLGAWIFVAGIHRLGIDVVPLLAGLGVGGLAVALAARPTIENVIGSFMIFADKPYRVGQRVNVMGQNGTVESIGLRSTKIRLLTGHLTSIPNEKMAAVEIENIGRRPYIRRAFSITITYDTPPEKINRAVEIVREILSVPEAPGTATTVSAQEREPHPNEGINQPDLPPRVYFNDLNADSLNILVLYWYHPAEYWDYLEHSHWVNLQIMERFRKEGIDFAFPTQTLHVAGDDKRPINGGQYQASRGGDQSQDALAAQSTLINQPAASQSARPQARGNVGLPFDAGEELTDAPLEDDLMHGDDGSAPDDGGDDTDDTR
jgi:MscS family membrane protein